MTRITLTIATVLSLAFTPLAAQETNCDDWMSSDWDVTKQFWEAVTLETVADCLNSGSSVNARTEYGATPLHRAALNNRNPEVLTLLLEAGADVNARDEGGATPLYSAAFGNKNPEVLTVLLEAGADVDARAEASFRNEVGDTPLHGLFISSEGMTLFSQNPEVITLLLDAGADVNARNAIGDTPLHRAAHATYSKTSGIVANLGVITVLLDGGADVNARNGNGMTPLHKAVEMRDFFNRMRHASYPEIITVFINAGADVNAKAKNGMTPLHLASESTYNPEVLTVLLEAGADGTAVNDDGETPFDLAKDNEALAGTDAYWALNDARFE